MKRLLMAACAAILFCSTATADDGEFGFYRGNTLQKMCKGVKDDYNIKAVGLDSLICIGYALGVADTVVAIRTDNKAQLGNLIFETCMLHPVTVGSLTEVVAKYIGQHPATRHYPGAALAIMAMNEAWPCPKLSGQRID